MNFNVKSKAVALMAVCDDLCLEEPESARTWESPAGSREFDMVSIGSFRKFVELSVDGSCQNISIERGACFASFCLSFPGPASCPPPQQPRL